MIFARVVQWKGSMGVDEAETELHISGAELKQMEEFAAKVERGGVCVCRPWLSAAYGSQS